MKTVTTLGPYGTTFAEQAYQKFRKHCSYIETADLNPESFRQVYSNDRIVDQTIYLKGFGCIPISTLKKGILPESIESFIGLLDQYSNSTFHRMPCCPLQIIGMVDMGIIMCLIGKKDSSLDEIQGIIAHKEAFRICEERINQLFSGIQKEEVGSNGEARRRIQEDARYKNWLALGPQDTTGSKYITNHIVDFSDNPARTLFYILDAHTNINPNSGSHNRMLIVFRINNKPGALLTVLNYINRYGLNMTDIHSMRAKDGSNNFAIEIEISAIQYNEIFVGIGKKSFIEGFGMCVDTFITFGPFPVLTVN